MKIEGPKHSSQIDKKKKADQSGSGDGPAFSSFLSDKAGAAEQKSAGQSIARVDGLLAVQASEDPTERAARKRMTHRAHDILDELDVVKMALLNGNLTAQQIINVSNLVAVNREKVADPQLSNLLDEIDLRAQVELAKLEAAKEQALKHLQNF